MSDNERFESSLVAFFLFGVTKLRTGSDYKYEYVPVPVCGFGTVVIDLTCSTTKYVVT